MRIVTEPDYIGVSSSHRLAKHFSVLSYRSGALSFLPRGLYRNWLDEDISGSDSITLHIGHCSGFGVGSIVKHDTPEQTLRMGRFVSAGLRLRFLLNGQHETGSISTYMFSTLLGSDFQQPATPQYGDTVLKNDIWIGDEAMFLGGCVIENGCLIAARALIPPNFKSEPYGIYGGVPARLIRFRFNERICQALQRLAWWEMPLQWIRCNTTAFLARLDRLDTEEALELLAKLQAARESYLETHQEQIEPHQRKGDRANWFFVHPSKSKHPPL